jgi:hypothetical protein
MTRVELRRWTPRRMARRLSKTSSEGGQVGGDDAQKVAGLTDEPLGLPDVRDGGDSLIERLDARSPRRMMGGVRNPV